MMELSLNQPVDYQDFSVSIIYHFVQSPDQDMTVKVSITYMFVLKDCPEP